MWVHFPATKKIRGRKTLTRRGINERRLGARVSETAHVIYPKATQDRQIRDWALMHCSLPRTNYRSSFKIRGRRHEGLSFRCRSVGADLAEIQRASSRTYINRWQKAFHLRPRRATDDAVVRIKAAPRPHYRKSDVSE